jgi:hypothetical protein
LEAGGLVNARVEVTKITDKSAFTGAFTLSFYGYETVPIGVDAAAATL